VYIIPHQSASQTASPKGSLKPPEFRKINVDNTKIDFSESLKLVTKIRKSDYQDKLRFKEAENQIDSS
jgi:hypothetical protein